MSIKIAREKCNVKSISHLRCVISITIALEKYNVNKYRT